MTNLGVTGHQNIPPIAVDFIRDGVTKIIRNTGNGVVGITALASGADQLFADLVLISKGQLHVVIPCRRYEETFSNKVDLHKFIDLRNRADVVEILDFEEPSEGAFLAAGHRIVELSDLLIAIWDGGPARGKGGTADVVQYANKLRVDVKVLWPPGINR